MSIHLCIVFRKFFKKIYHFSDIRENFDSRLYHGRNLAQVKLFCQDFSQVRLRHLIESVEIHRLHIFAVHPF